MSRNRLTLIALALATALVWPGAASSDGLPVPVDTTRTGVTPSGGGARFFAIPAKSKTVVLRLAANGARVERQLLVSGRLVVPAVAIDGSPGGLSADGGTLVLIEPRPAFPRSRTRFAVLDARRLRVLKRIGLRGDFSFDAISPDGSTIYLVHYTDPRDPTAYEVRAYDLARSRLRADPIVDSETAEITMRGFPVKRLTGRDGRWEYTLYDGGGGTPFVHALDTVDGTSACIAIPQLGSRAASNASLSLSGGAEIVVGHPKQGPVASVDTASFAVTGPREPESSDDTLSLVLIATSLLIGFGLIVRARRRRRPPAGRASHNGHPSANGRPVLHSRAHAHLQRHPAHRAQASRQLHRGDPPVRGGSGSR
jgi:hypothetical protein